MSQPERNPARAGKDRRGGQGEPSQSIGAVCIGPGPSVWIAEEDATALVDTGWRALGACAVLGGGSDLIETEDAYQQHTHERGGKQEGLPAGLKGNIVHERLFAALRA